MIDTNLPTGAKAICDALAAAGVTTLFGVPGDTGVAWYDALHGSPDLTHILVNDERGAVFAADAYARTSGRIGVAEVSSGGGSTFCVGGLGEAHAASIPLLLISSDIHRGSKGTGALTETDQVAMFSAVTKKTILIGHADEIPPAIRQAIREACNGRPGPVALVIPEDVFEETCRVEIGGGPISIPDQRPIAESTSVQTVADLWSKAGRPAILAGGGIHLSNAYEALRKLAELTDTPVATSIHGKGAIAESHRLALGVVGGNGGREYATEYVAGSDFVLLLGTRANATDTDGFRAPGRGTAVVTVDIDPNSRSSFNYPNAVNLIGDAREVLVQLAERMPDQDRRAVVSELSRARSLWRLAYADPVEIPGALDPWEAMCAVRSALPPSHTVVADCGTPTPYLAARWEADRAGRVIVTPRGHGPMGYAMPAAVGAAHAAPDDVIIVFTTDGSMLMAAGALETAARSGKSIIYVQFSNGSMGWIKALQHFYHEGRYFSTELSRYNPADVARGFGLPAVHVQSLDDLATAVKEAVAARGPAFIDLVTPDEHLILPPVSSWRRVASGDDTSRPVY